MRRFYWLLANCLVLVVLTVSALALSLVILNAFSPGERISEKSLGGEEQRFYLLLIDRAYVHSINGRKYSFRFGMSEEKRKEFSVMLNSIHYKKDCLLDRSFAVGGGISCDVDGRLIDFIEYSR